MNDSIRRGLSAVEALLAPARATFFLPLAYEGRERWSLVASIEILRQAMSSSNIIHLDILPTIRSHISKVSRGERHVSYSSRSMMPKEKEMPEMCIFLGGIFDYLQCPLMYTFLAVTAVHPLPL